MPDINIESEIRDIRAHLDRLQQQRDEEATSGDHSEHETEEYGPETNTSKQSSEEHSMGMPTDVDGLLDALNSSEWAAAASSHAKEWLSALNEDLKGTKPTTLLAIFGLGVLVGRLTSK